MNPSTLATTKKKPPKWWALITFAAGAVGALVAIQLGGHGIYKVPPFDIELRARPAFAGKTELAIKPVSNFVPSHAEAGTHAGPMAFRATILNVQPGTNLISDDLVVDDTPYDLSKKLSQDGKSAVTKFAIKLIFLTLFGSALGGAAISFGRWKRILGAILAGIVTMAIIGVMIQSTYDSGKFKQTSYVIDQPTP